MGSDSIDPGIRIVAQTASASFLSRLHTTASRHPQRLDAPADWGKFRITLSGKGFVRLSRFSPALPATSAPPLFSDRISRGDINPKQPTRTLS
ncbi:MAG: hypothetical protein SD837_13170 [Candidatus Electrothrix scaldis]|nr:MAG: hypothetical protein SD837_13170 [Candidatus Electrothrix sp. GW3-3]